MTTVRSVLHVSVGLPPEYNGGSARYVAELAAAQEKLGLDVRVLTLSSAPGRFSRTTVGHDVNLARRLWALWRTSGPEVRSADILDYHFPLYSLPVALRNLYSRIPAVTHFHGPWYRESQASGDNQLSCATKRSLERFVYRQSCAIITESSAFQHEIQSLGVSAPLYVVHPGVDLQRFRPMDRSYCKSQMSIESKGTRPLLVTARRLVPRTGLDTLIKALALLEDPADLLILGDGPERPRLEHLAGACCPDRQIVFAGTVSDDLLVQAYNAADLVVVPSAELEGFGLVVLEAFACGTPVVATDVGGLREALGPLARELPRPRDPTSLARAISTSLISPPARDICRRYAETRTWISAAEETASIYERASVGGTYG